jgi:2-dehydro-3-deoxyphosphogluconate aldolase/(4S)-4-hydroxy-2-oxoglutarate aldolase
MSEAQVLIGSNAARSQVQAIDSTDFISQASTSLVLTRQDVVACIEKTGLIPVLRLESAEDALFVAEALAEAGVPIIEVSMAESGALGIVSHLARHAAGTIVGAGNIFNADGARRCFDAGAKFLASDIFVPQVVELAGREGIAVIPGALTPTEVMTAWTAGSDFVKVTPCFANGDEYIRSLNAALPQVRLIAAGGVNQRTALSFIKAGASALSAGNELIPVEAVWLRQTRRIQEMARRFLNSVEAGRSQSQRADG